MNRWVVLACITLSVCAGVLNYKGTAHAQQPSTALQGVVVRPNGVYLIDRTREVVPDLDLTDGEQQPAPRMLPTRVIFGEQLTDDLSVCREREDGTTDCKMLGQLFPAGVKK